MRQQVGILKKSIQSTDLFSSPLHTIIPLNPRPTLEQELVQVKVELRVQ